MFGIYESIKDQEAFFFTKPSKEILMIRWDIDIAKEGMIFWKLSLDALFKLFIVIDNRLKLALLIFCVEVDDKIIKGMQKNI